jgi:hypothetical protein
MEMAARHEVKVVVSEQLRQMDLTELVEVAAEYPGGAEFAERITTNVNRTSCNGCTMNANMAALRVWIAKRENGGMERIGAK